MIQDITKMTLKVSADKMKVQIEGLTLSIDNSHCDLYEASAKYDDYKVTLKFADGASNIVAYVYLYDVNAPKWCRKEPVLKLTILNDSNVYTVHWETITYIQRSEYLFRVVRSTGLSNPIDIEDSDSGFTDVYFETYKDVETYFTDDEGLHIDKTERFNHVQFDVGPAFMDQVCIYYLNYTEMKKFFKHFTEYKFRNNLICMTYNVRWDSRSDGGLLPSFELASKIGGYDN